MGKVTDKIRKIMVEENLSLQDVFVKYPHLAELQKDGKLDKIANAIK